jgi:TolB-like protein
VRPVVRIFNEARRRKVFRTAGFYVVGAWIALQVAALMFPGFGIPEAAIRALIWAAVAGLPVALAFGWLFEIGPGGIRRTLPAGADAALAPQPLARRDYLLLAAFGAIALALVYRTAQDVRELPHEPAVADAGSVSAEERLPNSVAVLPFANISDDPGNDYFCDGIAEEILDHLSKAAGLNVIGRTSSFAFKGSDYAVDRISSLLRVRYVLQGSVRKAGDQLRVSAQLLDAGGVQVWSQSFDRKLENVFEIQSDIAAAVANTVASQVTPPRDTGHQPELAAYEHFLKGRDLLHQRHADLALVELEKAVEIDPEFAEAHAELAIARSFDNTPDNLNRARRSLERATELKPRLLRARAGEAFLLLARDPSDPAGAERILRELLAQDPNMSDALLWLQNALHEQGRDDEARPVLERAALIDPMHPSIAANLAERLLEEGRTLEAQRLFERVLAQPAPGPMIVQVADGFYRSTGRLVEMTAMIRKQALRRPSFVNLFFFLQGCAALGDWDLAEALNDRLLRVPPEGPGRLFRGTILPGLKGETAVVLHRMREAFDEQGVTIAGLDTFGKIIAGTHLARGGDYAAAIDTLEPLVDAGSPYATEIPNPAYSPALHMLAWSYLNSGAESKAAPLLAAAARYCGAERTGGRLRDSARVFRCAEVELLRGNTEAALAGLEQAIEAGWREYYVREHDPVWARLATEPRYRASMERVKADVDRQRAEFERTAPASEVLAQIDAGIEAATPGSR